LVVPNSHVLAAAKLSNMRFPDGVLGRQFNDASHSQVNPVSFGRSMGAVCRCSLRPALRLIYVGTGEHRLR
ncbi:MAG: hypothetical protein J2P55_17100, partial [Rhizobiales bacterium]|nr:hypothetical protein [Hyphomicrobiales bacterium]